VCHHKATRMLSDTVTVALISSSSSVAVAITALILSYRLFNSLEWGIDRIEDKLDLLTGKVAEVDNRLTRVEDKLGISPR
jgi:hypothetical protein